MRCIVQRVSNASVTTDEIETKISTGLLVYVCFIAHDLSDDSILEKMQNKIVNLRIFSDAHNKLNESLVQTHGELLIIPNFTLCADCKKGTRPNFSTGISAEDAKKLFEKFVFLCKQVVPTYSGVFAAKMQVSSTNMGPINIVLDM